MGIHAYDDDRVEHTTLLLITHEQSIVIKVKWTRTTSNNPHAYRYEYIHIGKCQLLLITVMGCV